MSRELRRVPPNWEQPKYRNPYRGVEYVTMFDRTLEDAQTEWDKDCEEYASLEEFEEDYGERPTFQEASTGHIHRPWKDEEATWFQVWQTVSEGTPVTPAFATRQELYDYLVKYGEFDERGEKYPQGHRYYRPYSPEAAKNMTMGDGWFPSGILEITPEHVDLRTADGYTHRKMF